MIEWVRICAQAVFAIKATDNAITALLESLDEEEATALMWFIQLQLGGWPG